MALCTQDAKTEDKPYLSDAITFVIAALLEVRHMRIIAKFGFTAARLLQEEKEDPLISREQLKRISHLPQRRQQTGGQATHTASRQATRSARSFSTKRPFIPTKSRFFRRKKEVGLRPLHERGRKQEWEK
ncbi:uncharacterized protein MONOS_9305 [Monocercomonoides exilis]|uniref:uncharacterized protein n=1 Tax=Monocercomonoides exilis TaxID=2049356 RepID=UPI00355AC695|nr:hypothetical protein MONOS_9305 [Monocercomonoides exilis]|eukprot:MONOS_9305.1-p1 / transcript=MONOS_9305.1 / gene=MONOS_9305 / organism=Monocercomonoides_exilis_PA203 / gene_product=unspecified product / transcript_product=unspecified product / location=Mono_scaffold00379:1089-1478(-) / protein_length=130 / sequence_SO=supercontig / SO=protein_coding / is_pseudo=false